MVDKEVEEVPAKEVEVEDEGDDVVEVIAKGKRKKGAVKTKKKSRVRKQNKHVEDWLKILPGFSNAISANDHIFKEPYFLCRATKCTRIDGFGIFMYFY